MAVTSSSKPYCACSLSHGSEHFTFFSQGHSVVLQKDDFQLVSNHRVIVHHVTHSCNEFDDHFSHVVSGSSLEKSHRLKTSKAVNNCTPTFFDCHFAPTASLLEHPCYLVSFPSIPQPTCFLRPPLSCHFDCKLSGAGTVNYSRFVLCQVQWGADLAETFQMLA